MLGELIGSINKERALVYLVARETGHAREIARFFDVPLNPMIQKALDGLERQRVLSAPGHACFARRGFASTVLANCSASSRSL
jgi:hypothetical protein